MQKINLIDEDKNLCPCCINCQRFTWWEEDWCCTWHMKIIQYGNNFDDTVLERIQTPATCSDYAASNLPWVEDFEKQFINEMKL